MVEQEKEKNILGTIHAPFFKKQFELRGNVNYKCDPHGTWNMEVREQRILQVNYWSGCVQDPKSVDMIPCKSFCFKIMENIM